MQDTFIETNRGRFGVRCAGETDAPVVLCLHGFPDDASTYDELATKLAAAGYRAVAPYLRGYAPSPLDGPLTLEALVDDLFALADAVSPNRPVFLIGHDYGSQIGYAAMARDSNRFAAAVTLAGAHPAAINKNMRRLPRQWWMSRYIVFFQFGTVAERKVARDGFAYIDELWRRWSPGFRAPATHLARVKRTLERSMPAPIAMYRAGGFDIGADAISTPTLFIAGANDGCLLPELSRGQEKIFTGRYASSVWPDAGHFPHLERPGRTAESVIAWFANREVISLTGTSLADDRRMDDPARVPNIFPTSDTGAVRPALAALLASSAFVVPFALSASTSPTLLHPRIFFWYRWLRKPSFKPPDAAIPLAWAGIESALAFAGYRLLRRRTSPARNRSLAWLAVNILAIGGWSRQFFGQRNLPVSTVAAAAMVGAGAAYVNEARKVDRKAALAGVPFVAWVAFATVLTGAIWRRNR